MIKPHASDELQPLFVEAEEKRQALLEEAETLPQLLLNSAAAANAVMLGTGYFSPLPGYMNIDDAIMVAEEMHTTAGLFWPLPCVNMSTDTSAINGATRIALRDPNVAGRPVIAIQDVTSVDTLSDDQIAQITEKVFGTLDRNHPGVATFSRVRKPARGRSHRGTELQLLRAGFPRYLQDSHADSGRDCR